MYISICTSHISLYVYLYLYINGSMLLKSYQKKDFRGNEIKFQYLKCQCTLSV